MSSIYENTGDCMFKTPRFNKLMWLKFLGNNDILLSRIQAFSPNYHQILKEQFVVEAVISQFRIKVLLGPQNAGMELAWIAGAELHVLFVAVNLWDLQG